MFTLRGSTAAAAECLVAGNMGGDLRGSLRGWRWEGWGGGLVWGGVVVRVRLGSCLRSCV